MYRASSIQTQVDSISALSLTWDSIVISGKSFDGSSSAISSYIIDLFKEQLKVGCCHLLGLTWAYIYYTEVNIIVEWVTHTMVYVMNMNSGRGIKTHWKWVNQACEQGFSEVMSDNIVLHSFYMLCKHGNDFPRVGGMSLTSMFILGLQVWFCKH